MPHTSSAFRYLGVICDIYILSRSPILSVTDLSGTADSCYATKSEQENKQNNVIEGYVRRYMAVDTDQLKAKRLKDGSWQKGTAEKVLQVAGTQLLQTYLDRRQATGADWKAFLPMFEVCT